MSKNGSRHALQLGDTFRHLRELNPRKRKALEKKRLQESYKKVKRVQGTTQRSYRKLNTKRSVNSDSISTLKKNDGSIYKVKFTDLKGQQAKSMKINEVNLIFTNSPLANRLLGKSVGESIHLIATNVKYDLTKIE